MSLLLRRRLALERNIDERILFTVDPMERFVYSRIATRYAFTASMAPGTLYRLLREIQQCPQVDGLPGAIL